MGNFFDSIGKALSKATGVKLGKVGKYLLPAAGAMLGGPLGGFASGATGLKLGNVGKYLMPLLASSSMGPSFQSLPMESGFGMNEDELQMALNQVGKSFEGQRGKLSQEYSNRFPGTMYGPSGPELAASQSLAGQEQESKTNVILQNALQRGSASRDAFNRALLKRQGQMDMYGGLAEGLGGILGGQGENFDYFKPQSPYGGGGGYQPSQYLKPDQSPYSPSQTWPPQRKPRYRFLSGIQ